MGSSEKYVSPVRHHVHNQRALTQDRKKFAILENNVNRARYRQKTDGMATMQEAMKLKVVLGLFGRAGEK